MNNIKLGKHERQGTYTHAAELDRLAAVGDPRSTDIRLFSKSIWRNCPYFQLKNGLRDGFAHFDDMLGKYAQAASVAAASTTLVDPWCGFTDGTAGTTISAVVPTDTGIAGDAVGAISLNSTTTQEGAVIGLHTALNTSAPIGAPTASNRIWLEGRIKATSATSAITTEEIAFFFGLLPAAKVATPVSTVFATAGSVMAAIDHVGFMKIAAGTTAIKTVHGNGTATVLSATAAVLADATYTKLGMVWDGARFTFFQDGVALATRLALGATQFPAGANLAVHLAMQDGSGAGTNAVLMDWVRVAYQRV